MPGLKVEWREGIAYAVGTFDGKRIRRSLKTRDKKTADEQCALFEAKLWKRHSYGEEAVRTFEEAAVSYQKQGGEGRFLAPILRYFKGRNLGSIKPGEVRTMAITCYPDATPATRNRQGIVPARAVINHGASLGWNPPVKVDLFPVQKSRKHKPVTEDWLREFMEQCDTDGLPHLGGLVLFLNRTAARVSEGVNLLGEHVDLANAVAVLAKTKTDEWVPVYLPADVVAYMGGLGIEDGERVFRYTDRSSVNRAIARVCRRAGIEARTTHSAGRHSFGTNVIALGADVKRGMEAGRWKSARLFLETYVHSDEAGRAVADLLTRKLSPIAAIPAQSKPRKRYRFGNKR
jgi:integrase